MATKRPESKTTSFKTLDALFCHLAEQLKPTKQMTVSEAAEKWRKLNNPGAYVGDWLNHMVYPMVEPMNTFTSREYEGLVFVGPAQSSKTDSLVLNPIVHAVMVDAMDLMLVCPTNTDGRDFSIRRVDRLHRHSTEVGEMLLPGSEGDNKFDKQYSNGVLFTIAWPTASQLAGKPVPRVILTDRDRMDDDIEGDGEPFDLAMKRTTTFGSYAMTVAESSPSKPILDFKWLPKSDHEAPPCEGILKLYNRGDRRRWLWPCPHCDQYFEGEFSHLEWDTEMEGTNKDKSKTVFMRCPHCHEKIMPNDRALMQEWGVWLKDGQGIDKLGRVFGPKMNTRIASFWLKGVAAAFVTWSKLVSIYLDAHDEWERTGSEEGLRKFYNTDCGEPYYPKSMDDNERTPSVLKGRAEKNLEMKVVPKGVRFLIATIDVQKNMFIVQVFGIIAGKRFDTLLIDRFSVKYSKRLNEDDERLWVKPHTYSEDWEELIEHVLEKTYPLKDDPENRVMGIRFTGCDSGGKAGVTGMAYKFYRTLRSLNKARNFILIKGDPLPNKPRWHIEHPDSQNKTMMNAAKGEIPVLFLNSNVMKDDLHGRLMSIVPGEGMYRTPNGLSDNFYNELCAEVRTPKGWDNPTQSRNEAIDLSYYCLGICISSYIGAERIDWTNPPGWAHEDWDMNTLVYRLDDTGLVAVAVESEYDFAAAGKALA